MIELIQLQLIHDGGGILDLLGKIFDDELEVDLVH
jgi:hypothetical protein